MSNHKRDEDDRLQPNDKYKGILYTPRSSSTANDLPTVTRRGAASAKKRGSIFDAFGPVKRTGSKAVNRKTTGKRFVTQGKEPLHRTRGSAAPVQDYSSTHKPVTYSATRRNAPAPQVVRSGGQRNGKTFSFGGFFRDRFLKNVLVVCTVVVIASVIAIPTAFAKPTTNITISDKCGGEGARVLDVSTSAQTVGECLEVNNIILGEEDILESDPSTPITEDMNIIIWRAMPVTVHTGTESIEINMVAGTVQDALNLAGVVPAEKDEVYPSRDAFIRPGMKIDHIVVDVKQREEYRGIPFDKVEREDSKMAKGSTEIVQDGEEGEFEIIYEQIYKNGVLISEEIISEETIKEPVDQITAVGTYVAPKKKKAPTISNIHKGEGGSIEGANVKYTLSMQATAYCSSCNSGHKTASGTYPQRGTVAANLSVLPMGTKIYVPGYGFGVVEDTGGFGSNVVDLYMGDRNPCSCASEWGRKNVTVYVVG